MESPNKIAKAAPKLLARFQNSPAVNGTNSPANVIYVIVASYSDVNVVYDPKNKHFSSPYLQYMN